MPKRVIITGATSGIGRALAREFLRRGDIVGATGRRQERLEELRAIAPDRVYSACHDLRDYAGLPEVLDYLSEQMGGVELVVANAGISRPNAELALQPELETLSVNAMAFTVTAIWAAQRFIRQGSGHLVGISSVAAFATRWDNPAYPASKAFEQVYLRGLHANLMRRGIYVTDIRPGFVDTEMIKGNPRAFWVAPVDKAACQIVRGIERRKRVVYVTRRWRFVSWLMRMIPNEIYRRVR